MKFDKIIMNPPYDGQLHLKIFDETYKHLNKNGCCVNLSPTTWLAKYNNNRPMAKYRKIFNGRIKDIEIIDHTIANSLFGTGNSIAALGIYVVKNDESSTIDLLNYGFQDNIEKTLYDKIGSTANANCLTFPQWISLGKGSQGGIEIKENEVNVYTWHGGKNCYDAVIRLDNKKRSFVLYFNSNIEKQNFLDSLNTKFMNWYWQMFVVPGNNKIRNYIFIMGDYTEPWTDERFYKFFKINEDEQKIIEETMEKYK